MNIDWTRSSEHKLHKINKSKQWFKFHPNRQKKSEIIDAQSFALLHSCDLG